MTIPFSPIIDEAMEGGSETRPDAAAPSHRPAPDALPAESSLGLPAIIARLEAATTGSRILDAAVYEATRKRGTLKEEFARLASLPVPDYGRSVPIAESIPHYTTSLDAALTLVPVMNGPRTWMLFGRTSSRYAVCEAKITAPSREWQAFAQSPALALCIAALKARAASLTDDGA